jgi:hypothetical protein
LKLSLIIAAAAVVSATGFVTLPVQAAPIACDHLSSTSMDPINDNSNSIAASVAAKGIKVSGLEDFGGHVRGYVKHKDGTIGMAYFDPASLNRLDGYGQ